MDVDDVAAAVSVSVFGVDDVDVDVPPAVVAVAVAVTKLIFSFLAGSFSHSFGLCRNPVLVPSSS